MSEGAIETIKEVFTPEDFAKIIGKMPLVAGHEQIVAEDDTGATYNYSEEGFPEPRPVPAAAKWFGVEPIPEEWP